MATNPPFRGGKYTNEYFLGMATNARMNREKGMERRAESKEQDDEKSRVFAPQKRSGGGVGSGVLGLLKAKVFIPG